MFVKHRKSFHHIRHDLNFILFLDASVCLQYVEVFCKCGGISTIKHNHCFEFIGLKFHYFLKNAPHSDRCQAIYSSGKKACLGAGQVDVEPIVKSRHYEFFNSGSIKFELAVVAILKNFIRQVYFRRKSR